MGLLFLLLWLMYASAPSGTPEAKLAGAKLEARYRGVQTMKAAFLERYSENGQVLRTEAGVAYFRRPGRMRWEYDSPEKNLFLVDGKTAWFYVPADRTVTRVPSKDSNDWRTPLALLAGEMKLSRVCARVEMASGESPQTVGDAVLYCSLRGENGKSAGKGQASHSATGSASGLGEEVYLEVAPDGDLARVLFRQRGGVEVEFRFTSWQLNPPLAASLFRFAIPLGVAIVNGDSSPESVP